MSQSKPQQIRRAAPRSAWKQGQSGNPGGRPAIAKEIKALARTYTPDALDALRKALAGADRVPAATILLAYGYGRPVARNEFRVVKEWGDLSEAELMALAGMAKTIEHEEPTESEGE